MNASLGTATLIEAIWTLVSVPGVLLWGGNFWVSLLTLRAARQSGFVNGRMAWARFGVLLTASFSVVEIVSFTAGCIAMLRPSNLDGRTFYSYTFAGIFIFAALVVAYVGFEWRRVDSNLVSNARRRATADRIEES